MSVPAATDAATDERGASATLVLHPEAVDGEPATLRWVTLGAPGFVGVPSAVPAALADLLVGAPAPGVLSRVAVEPGAVLTTLAAGRTWSVEGGAVRSALGRALAEPDAWSPPVGAGADDVLAAVVEQVLAGEVGEYARSHGGRITLVSAVDGAVRVRLSGACTHCPAAGTTLDQRVEAAVRARHPALVSLTAVPAVPVAPGEPGGSRGSDPAVGGRRRLGLLPLRRG